MENNSKKFSINGLDIAKTIRGVLITFAAVAITAVLDHVANTYTGVDYNVCISATSCIDLKFLIVPLIGGILEIGRRWVTDFRNK